LTCSCWIDQKQKAALARQLNLKPRQVEVWFQNRRARTKLKQTEADCDLLRRWCDHLAADNARLRRDLAELRRSSSSPPVSGLAVATPVVCPSCAHDDKRRLAFATAAAAAGDMASN
jgi:homeobox-leucine zipper protein